MAQLKMTQAERAHVALERTVDGYWIVLVDGLQWSPPGAPRDRSGAGAAEYPTRDAALRAYRGERSPRSFGALAAAVTNPYMGNPIIDNIVGRRHVGESDDDIVEYALSRLTKKGRAKMTPEQLAHFREAVVAAHRRNQKLYRDVMRGR